MLADSFTLKQIAEWQINPEQSTVDLPTIQRGFVWKPKQVEDLWDSILRGYPVGSLLFSRTGEKLHLMDGQQRATSIFLGQFNPYNPNHGMKAWSIKGELPVVWIDLKPSQKPFANKFLIRLTTRSHPWGYKSNYNDEKLPLRDRRDALEVFKKHPNNSGGYTTFKNSTVFPYDASFPLPLSLLIDAENVGEVITKADNYLPEYFQTKNGGFSGKAEFIILLRTTLKVELESIFADVKGIQKFTIKSNTIENTVLNEENEAEDPTLFVRINSAGTPLTGDDLIYSIYKASFPEAKNVIENIGMKFISPPQVLSLISRLVASDLESNQFMRKFNVREFQKKIKNQEYCNKLSALIQSGIVDHLFTYALGILSCKENPLFEGQLPAVIVKQFIKKSPDLFLFLLCWMHIHGSIVTHIIQLKMVAKLLTFNWFDLKNVQKLWNENVTNPNFWNEPINELIWQNDAEGLQFLIKPELLTAYYKQDEVMSLFKGEDQHRWGLLRNEIGDQIIYYFNDVKSENTIHEKANEYFWKFIRRIQFNKELILFAQRSYMNTAFQDFNQMDDIEDTNAPWDWDHIYPSEWVYRKVYCNQSIRDWNNSIGNLRAISLEHNRSRGNSQPPKDITDKTERLSSFIIDNDWTYWQEIHGRISNNEVEKHFLAVITRMLNIYTKFWNDLKISELITINK